MLSTVMRRNAAKCFCGAALALSLVAAPAVALADEEPSSLPSNIRTYSVFDEIETQADQAAQAQAAAQAAQQRLQDTVTRANEELGTPYANGGVGPNAYDCSGFVGYCLTGVHERLGTTWTYMGWEQISAEEAQPGDVVTSGSHCGIYIGDGMMIHAPRTGKVVEVAEVYDNMIYVKAPADL